MNIKFLLKLVSCCCINPQRDSGNKEQKRLLGDQAAPLPKSGEQRGRKRRRHFKRVRNDGFGGRGSGGSAVEWRPSLNSISEEHVLSVRNDQEGSKVRAISSSKASSSDRNLRRKLRTSPTGTPPSSYDDIFRRNAQQMTISVFSPAPFMI